jgi:gliding motility-associated-like protein
MCYWFCDVIVQGQNLIPDPGFELIKGCPKLYEFDSLIHWQQASVKAIEPNNTTQYGLLYHTCNGLTPKTNWGYYETHNGSGMASVVSKFIYTKTTVLLKKGNSYRCSFWLKVGTKNNISCWWQTYNDKFSIFTFKDKPLDTIVGSYRQIPAYTWNITEKYDTNWIRFECCFKAQTDAQYIGFGYANTILNLSCEDEVSSKDNYRPPFLTVETKYAFRQLPFFIDDIELEEDNEKVLPSFYVREPMCPGSTIILNGNIYLENHLSSNIISYKWDNGARTRELPINETGEYKLIRRIGCSTQHFTFKTYLKNCYCTIYVPNIFSPNDDTFNDNIQLYIKCSDAQVSRLSFSIFNRWGSRVFYTDKLTDAWDGYFNKKSTVSGVYIWVLDYDIVVGSKTHRFVESGDITVLH